ncbi:VOC family protein [Onishia niordana]|uniref:VOC family protein n=1 Tax=Onishia niordana TaxID=2508711 RepID=UPI0010A0235F|nr:hypothetical protein [Halomonas niordiana]
MQRLSLDKATLRVRDIDAQVHVFREVLPLLLATPTGAVFELGTDVRGNTQVLMLVKSDNPSPPRRMALEVPNTDFARLCERLIAHGAHLYQSQGSSAPGCAWRVLSCPLPEGHYLQILAIDPSRCAPTTISPTATGA